MMEFRERACRLSVPELPSLSSGADLMKDRLKRDIVDKLVFLPGPNEQLPLVVPGGNLPRGSALKFILMYWFLTCAR